MWGTSIFIILVFMLLALQVTAAVGIKTIQENWGDYRCNPLIIPFASSISPNKTTAADNFSFCVKEFAMKAAPTLTQPLTYVQNMTLDLLGEMTKANESSVQQTSMFSFGVSNMFSSVFSTMAGVVSEFNLLFIKLMDAQGKLMGTMTSMMYIITTVQYTFLSMWNGIPGKMIRSAEKLSIKNKGGGGGGKKKKK